MRKPIRALAVLGLANVFLFANPIVAQEKFNTTPFTLAGKEFSLERGITKSLAEKLEASKTATPIILQFDHAPTQEQSARLREAGIILSTRINLTTWVASASANSARALYASPGIRAADIYPKAAKRSPKINLKKPYTWQQREKGMQAFSVLFHSETEAEQIEALRKSLDAQLEDYDKRAFSTVNTATVVIPPEKFDALLAHDSVLWVEPVDPPPEDENVATAQPLSNVDLVQLAPYNLTGNGVTVGVWEAGDVIDTTPLDLAGRVIVQAGQIAGSDDHAAHVAGTIGASGVNVPNAEGMAPAVTIASWDSANDTNEMTNAANSTGGAGQPTPIRVSNHSYGVGRGWSGGVFTNDQVFFGQYTNISQAFDNVVAQTDLIVFKAAGNERNDAPAVPVPGQPADCFQGGLGIAADCLGNRATAKNIITVGAMNGAGAITTFSSFGPTDDGRIKPDVMAEGNWMLSLACNCFDDRDGDGFDDVPNSTTATRFMGGTSMSTPVGTGTAALLLEEAANQGINLGAAAMKALLIQTAQDVNGPGQSTLGPDFATGWGIIDAQAAADLLRLPAGPGVAQSSLNATGLAGGYTQSFYLPAGLAEAHVTLAWVDPAGNPANPSGAQLVNDLDLRLIAPDDSVFQPWTLNPANPGAPAVRNGGDDSINNVEQVSVLAPMEGVWTLRVTAKPGSLVAGPQAFAVAGPFYPTAGPIASTKANISMVMDRSGSMILPSSTPGLNKLQALQSAASQLVSFIEIVGGHNMGLVQFDTAVAPFAPPFDMQPLDNGSGPIARNRIGGMSIGDMTNIIDGVTVGQSQLDSPVATHDEDILVLFSDGRHNRPIGSDVSDIDTIMNADTRFFGIGFGTDVDSSVMPTVASNHDGLYYEEQTLSAGQLSKLFLTVGGLSVNEDVVIDPDYPLAPGATAKQTVAVSPYDRAITFAAHWDTPNPNQMQFKLIGPNRKCEIPLREWQDLQYSQKGQANHGLKIRSGDHYFLARVEFPYVCEKLGIKMHEGNWTLLATNKGNQDTVKITVLAKADFRMLAQARAYDGVGIITAAFDLNGKPHRTKAEVLATITAPIPSSDGSEKQDHYRREYPYVFPKEAEWEKRLLELAGVNAEVFKRSPEVLWKYPFAELGYLDPGKQVEAVKIEDKITNVVLVDDGTLGDVEAYDGIYTARIALSKEGLHQIRVTAQAELKGQVLTRESLLSVLHE